MIQRMALRLLAVLALASSAWSADIIAKANTDLTTNTTWGLVEAGASATQITRSSSTNTTTSYVYSSAFTCTNTDVIDGFLLRANRVNTTGTVSVALSEDNGTTATREVTINASDIPADATWVFFKFGSTLTCDGGADYKVGIKGSSAGNATFYRDGTAGNWARLLRTTADRTPVAADNFYIAGEWTAAATVTARTVTMNETATTDYGTMDIGLSGTVTYGATASTNYYLRLSGELNIWSGGTLNIGTVATPMPASSTAKLNLDSGSNVQYGVIVSNGGTFVAQGATKTVSSLLAANVSGGATSLTSSTSTGWLSGDEIILASTTRTAADTEKKTMSGAATGTTIPIAALASAHSGTSPTQAELVNLTRNVQIFGASASLQAYVLVNATATVDWDYAEFYWMGSGTSLKRGIDVAITTGSFVASYCSFHDFTASSSMGINVSALTSGTFTLQYSAVALTNDAAFNNAATTNTTWIVDNNFFIRNTTGNNLVVLSDMGGTYTNNTHFGSISAGLNTVYINDNGTWGTFSGNVSHSNAGRGFTTVSNPGAITTISNTTAWRNSDSGFHWNNGSAYPLTFDGFTGFGNATANLYFNGAMDKVTFNNITVNGDTTFSTPYGISITGTNLVLNNSSLGVASGIKTTHTTADIGAVIAASNTFTMTGSNVTSGSSTTFNVGTNVFLNAGFNKWGGVDGANRSYQSSYLASPVLITRSDTVIFKTASPSQRGTPLQTNVKSRSSIKTIALASGATTTISVWVRKSAVGDAGGANYNGAQPRLMVETNQSCGIGTGASDVVLDTMTEAVGTWEQLTGTTSAVSADCVLSAYVDFDGTAGWVNTDDWAASNAQSITDEKYWDNGTTDLTVGSGGSTSLGVPVLQINRWPSQRWLVLSYPILR